MEHETTYELERDGTVYPLRVLYTISPIDRTPPITGGDVTWLAAWFDGERFGLTDDETRKIIQDIEESHEHE